MIVMLYKISIDRVIDGDTIVCDIHLGFSFVLHDQRVRLLGVNTPELRGGTDETKRRAREATDYVRSLVESKQCMIETDEDREYDNFGRILATLFAGTINVCASLVSTGRAEVY